MDRYRKISRCKGVNFIKKRESHKEKMLVVAKRGFPSSSSLVVNGGFRRENRAFKNFGEDSNFPPPPQA